MSPIAVQFIVIKPNGGHVTYAITDLQSCYGRDRTEWAFLQDYKS